MWQRCLENCINIILRQIIDTIYINYVEAMLMSTRLTRTIRHYIGSHQQPKLQASFFNSTKYPSSLATIYTLPVMTKMTLKI